MDEHNEYLLDFDNQDLDSCLLGQGGNGFVFRYKKGNDKYAIKFLLNSTNRNKEVQKLQEIQDLFVEPFTSDYRITQYIDKGEITVNLNDKNINLFYIIMDLADGTIHDLMCDYHQNKENKFTYEELISQIKHLSETINILHKSSYAHRDIKPENILLKGKYPILADFGLSGSTIHTKVIKKGPKYWPNPEFVQACNESLQNIDKQSDIFNLGCLFFYFFTGKYPIGNINLVDELSIVENQELQNLLIHMIHYSKEDRLSNIEDALNIFNNI